MISLILSATLFTTTHPCELTKRNDTEDKFLECHVELCYQACTKSSLEYCFSTCSAEKIKTQKRQSK